MPRPALRIAPNTRTTRVAGIVWIAVAALALPLVPFVVIGELPGERWLSAADEGALQFALTGAALLAADMLLPVPSSLVGSMLGARLGFAAGFASTFAGLMLGQLLVFAAGRWLWRRPPPSGLAQAPTLAAIFLSRPVPVLAEAMVVAAVAARVAPARFMLACGAGNACYAAALALNGAELLPGALIGPGLIVPMALPVLAWLAWRGWQRRAARAQAPTVHHQGD